MNCASCDCRMVPSGARVPDGYRMHRGRGLCGTCHDRERKAGRIENWLPLRPGFRCSDGDCPICEDVRWMADTGAPTWEWADRVGTTAPALSRLLRRHGQSDLAAAMERVVKAA